MSIFRFNYVENEDLSASLVPGDASFKIVGVYDTNKNGMPLIDREGHPKLNVSVKVIDSSGNQAILYESLTVNTGWKVKAILDAVGLPHLYNKSGILNSDDVVGCAGKCVLELKKSEGYPDRMQVKQYVKAQNHLVTADTVKRDYSDELPIEEIPF